MNKLIGVLYLATSPSGRRYVGITTQSVRRRWSAHVRDARAGGMTRLSKAIRKYGPTAFEIRVLLRADWCYLNWIEPRAIESYGSRHPEGYNLREGGSQSRPHAETREKMRAAKLGKKASDETRAKMSASAKGRIMDDVRAAAIQANTGAKRTSEQCERMRQAALHRKPASSEARANMSAAAKAAWSRRK